MWNAVTGERTESPSYKIHQESIYRAWGPQSRAAEGHPPPEPPTQAVLDPALFPLFDGCCLVGRLEHGNTATPRTGLALLRGVGSQVQPP